MSKLAFLVPAVLVSSAGGAAAAYTVGAHAGLSLIAAAPETLIPATADAYVAIDRGAAQGAALAHLWSAYQSHPGTAPALAHLRADMTKGGFDMRRLTPLLSSLGDRAALAVWIPSKNTAQPGLAVVAQTRLTSLVGGGAPLHSLAHTAPAWAYEGTQVYRVTFDQGGGSGYGCLLAGDAVLTTDAATMKRVVDTAAGRVPALATDKTFTTTLAALPPARALTAYVAPSVAVRLRHELDKGYATLPPDTRRQLRRLQPAIDARPYALSITASNDGLAFNTTALPAGPVHLDATPNVAAGILARDTIYYASQDNLAALITPYLGLLPAGSLGQFEQQTGIDVRRDVLGWMNGEFAVDINAGVSPVVGRAIASMNARSQAMGNTLGPVTQGLSSQQSAGAVGGRLAAPAVPSLPGSIELAWHVDDPVAVQRSLDRLAAVAARDTNAPGPLLTTTTLPDGTRATVAATLPGLGYAFHDHWLIASSNLTADLGMTAAPLSSDPAYGAAMAHVSPGALTSVSYLDVTRLLAGVDAWMGYAKGAGLLSGTGSSDGWTWAQAEPLIAPLRSVVAVTHQDSARDTRAQVFAAIGG